MTHKIIRLKRVDFLYFWFFQIFIFSLLASSNKGIWFAFFPFVFPYQVCYVFYWNGHFQGKGPIWETVNIVNSCVFCFYKASLGCFFLWLLIRSEWNWVIRFNWIWSFYSMVRFVEQWWVIWYLFISVVLI